MTQRGRAQLHPLGRAGGSRGADDHGRTCGDPPISYRTGLVHAPLILHRVRGERLDELAEPGGRQARVERQDGRPGAVERRRQQFGQPRGGPLDQDRTQGTHLDVLPAVNDRDSSNAAHATLRWVPVSPGPAGTSPGLTFPPQAFRLSLRPRASTLRAAFTSRSWIIPQAVQVHSRTASGLGPSLTPHAEHTWLVGSNRPTRRNSLPYRAAFSWMSCRNCDQPMS